MNVVCISCQRITEPVFDARDTSSGREGGICRGCELRADSRIEILAIGGRQFLRTLKRGPVPVEQGRKNAKAAVGAAAFKKGG